MTDEKGKPWDNAQLTVEQVRDRRERTRAFLADAEAVDEFMEMVAAGTGVRSLCDTLGLAYATVQRKLAEDPRYDAALDTRAYAVMDEIEEIERRLLEEGMDPKRASVLIQSKQFRLERLNPRRFGARQQIDVKHTDMTKLHLEAMRQLANAPRTAIEARVVPEPAAPAALPVLDAECSPIDPIRDT